MFWPKYISRCCLDTMRLVDLLLVLLFEGRKALPKAGVTAISGRLPGLRRMDSTGERSHRQLIDCIRSKDTDALIDAVDNGMETIDKCSTLKPVLSGHSKRKQKIVFQDQLSLNAGQKYCRMLQREHSAILLTFIKLPFAIKTIVLSNLSGR